MATRPYTFSYAELKGATEDFNPANKLGEGGFGPVFKVSHCPNHRKFVIAHSILLYKMALIICLASPTPLGIY